MKSPRSNQSFLNRFTSLPILLSILKERRITLRSPRDWVDRNDAFYLERYKEDKRLATMLALCFTAKRETFHHWKIFSDGPSGVCIEFDLHKIIRGLNPDDGFRTGYVDYQYVNYTNPTTPPLETWPFLKRKAYEDEGEFRITYENPAEKMGFKNIPIEINSIRKITLSPWLHESVAPAVKLAICSMPGCAKVPVNQSSLLENSQWKAAIGLGQDRA